MALAELLALIDFLGRFYYIDSASFRTEKSRYCCFNQLPKQDFPVGTGIALSILGAWCVLKKRKKTCKQLQPSPKPAKL
jgi:hypothetical protein